MSSMLRSLARNRAKVNMKAKGMVQICKGEFFSNNWKKYAGFATIDRRKRGVK